MSDALAAVMLNPTDSSKRTDSGAHPPQGAVQAPTPSPGQNQKRAIKILAKSLYRELSTQGYGEKEIVAVATELLGEVAARLGQAGNRT